MIPTGVTWCHVYNPTAACRQQADRAHLQHYKTSVRLHLTMSLNTLLPHATNVLLLVLSAILFFCLSLKYLGNGWTGLRQIYGEDMFGPSLGRVWMWRSKVKVTSDKNALSAAITPGSVQMICARCKQCAAAEDGTIASLPGVISGDSVRCVWSNIFSSSILLVFTSVKLQQ